MKIKVFIERNGLNSSGIYDTEDGSILVLKDSLVSRDLKPHFKGSKYETLRKNLESNGIIKNHRFTRDYLFNKTSPAATVILGSNSNGKREWVDEGGLDLNSLTSINNKRSGSINTKINNKKDNIISLLLKECDKEVERLLQEIDKQIIQRTYVNTHDLDSMLKDIVSLRDKKDKIYNNRYTKEFLVEFVERLWDEYEEI